MNKTTDPLLRVTSVSKQFANIRAVNDLSFDVHSGEIVALLGPNGAGKTTVVRMIVDIFRCDSGSIQFSDAMRNGAVGGRAVRNGQRGLWSRFSDRAESRLEPRAGRSAFAQAL